MTVAVTSLATFTLQGRRADAIASPWEFATNDPTAGGLMGALVTIDGAPPRKVISVERLMHGTPVRQGEQISIVTEEA